MEKLTKVQQEIVGYMKSGFHIICTLTDEGKFHACGKRTVKKVTVKSMLRKGIIKPSGEGVLSGYPQSYTLTKEN